MPDARASEHVAGTLAYMGPEVLQGGAATVQSDIWSLGVVLYEMTAGRRPFEAAGGSAGLVAAILRDLPPPLPLDTPPGLARIIGKCLAKQPGERPARAGEVALALDVAEPHGVEPGVEAPRKAPPAPSQRVAWAAAAVLLLLGVATVLVLRSRSEAPAVLRLANSVQVTTGVGVEDFPAWSPDGQTLAFAAEPVGDPSVGNWDVWVTQAAGAPINRTAGHAGRDLFPSWSPDGMQLAFWSDRDNGGCFVMPALAGAARKIADASPLDPSAPQWSADGSRLACLAGDPPGSALDVVSVRPSVTAAVTPCRKSATQS
jgi:dipeptidyl aminopeptidase/acylaminoacyl peptidase